MELEEKQRLERRLEQLNQEFKIHRKKTHISFSEAQRSFRAIEDSLPEDWQDFEVASCAAALANFQFERIQLHRVDDELSKVRAILRENPVKEKPIENNSSLIPDLED